MKLCWLDARSLGEAKQAIIDEAVHQRIDAIVVSDPEDFAGLPPTIRKVLLVRETMPADLGEADVVVSAGEPPPDGSGVEFGRFVEITGPESLEAACRAACDFQWSVLHFRDPTKIPLEIVLAAAAQSEGSIITVAADVEEAEIIFGVLELGSDGVMLAPRAVGEITRLNAAAQDRDLTLDLVELEVTQVRHVGMGERVCIDTCTYLHEDEGMLIGSHSKGMILCVSETHPLPYMPTRPFRVNAGAIMSYTLSEQGRTNYLSELRAGGKVLAVDVKGQARSVTVGRVKIETRPLLSVDAVAPDGRTVNLILQDDWHVRVLGPGGTVLNSTHLKPGDSVLGHLPVADRHVGYPIDEFCLEQ
ncbi:3-dehydroquinate synthase II family protein [Nonomuraea typhae]|uniref:3-dehydroquinate synthase II family protein n=1 Tax=Nonomuraea typhae TaxID=2603600 RepID=A0ABW7YU63_9ACTN